jgi:hypothetical protein
MNCGARYDVADELRSPPPIVYCSQPVSVNIPHRSQILAHTETHGVSGIHIQIERKFFRKLFRCLDDMF